MKQINRFLKIGLVLAILGAGYFFTSLTIFDRTFIQLNASQKVNYIPFENRLNMQCDKADNLVPKLASSRFHLITWNVHKGQDTGWQEDLERLSKRADFGLNLCFFVLKHADFQPHFLCPLFLLTSSYQE